MYWIATKKSIFSQGFSHLHIQILFSASEGNGNLRIVVHGINSADVSGVDYLSPTSLVSVY